MIAAVLCPGPSLSFTWMPQRWDAAYNVVIAVNRAIDYSGAHYLVAGDELTFQRLHPNSRPTKGLVTMGPVLESFPRVQKEFGEIIHWNHLTDCRSKTANWGSVAAALLCRRLGVKNIHYYGCDLKGTTEYDHRVDFQNLIDRSEERWERERKELDEFRQSLLCESILIHFVKPWGQK